MNIRVTDIRLGNQYMLGGQTCIYLLQIQQASSLHQFEYQTELKLYPPPSLDQNVIAAKLDYQCVCVASTDSKVYTPFTPRAIENMNTNMFRKLLLCLFYFSWYFIHVLHATLSPPLLLLLPQLNLFMFFTPQ